MNDYGTHVAKMVLALVVLGHVAAAAERESRAPLDTWPRFRGPNGAGVSTATTIPTEWTEQDFRWRTDLKGVGHSSPVIWENAIYCISGDEASGKRIILRLDRPSGKITWTKDFDAGKSAKHSLNSFASATPVADADGVYACWATADELTVVNLTREGEVRWKVGLGPYRAGHGFGVSPIVYEELLIVPADQDGPGAIFALDRRTGKTVWRVARATQVTYSTPCIYALPGHDPEIIVTNWQRGIEALDPKTGETRWQAKVFSKDQTETAIGSPIVAGDLILGCAGWLGREKRIVAVRPVRSKDPAAPITIEEAYRFERRTPLSTTPLVFHGLLFLWSDEGIVTCADATTGKMHWQERIGGTYYGSPVGIGRHVYCMNATGECVVIEATPEKLHIVAKNPLGEPSHSTPAIVGGTLYLRTFSHLIALGGEAKSKSAK